MQLQDLGQYTHNQNHVVEHKIGFLEDRWRRKMAKKVIPKRL